MYYICAAVAVADLIVKIKKKNCSEAGLPDFSWYKVPKW
jgi:hypothetical protein